MALETLGVLRGELRGRLGFAAAGAAAGVNQTVLNSFIIRAQELLYELCEWARLRRYEDKTVGAGQYLIDYPVTANRDRIRAISILDNTTWTPPIERGIAPELYTTQDNRRRPYRWEPYNQIELFPKADKVYTARVFFTRLLNEFNDDDHYTTLDTAPIFTIALGNAKAHYRQPDAAIYTAQRDALILRLKGKQWGKDVFSPRDYTEEPLPKPVVV